MNLVLFDLDGTLLSGDSDFEWGQFLIAKGILDPELHAAQNAVFYQQYQEGKLNIDEFLAFQLAPLSRHSRAELDAWHREYLQHHILPIISPKARELVSTHLDQGDLCAVVTATNSFVTGPIVREFGIPHLIATIPAFEDGRFTGKARGLPAFREGKVARVDAWLESLGLYWGSFEESRFYSDSHNDLALLSRVDRPVAVNPDKVLRAQAQEKGWEIISLR